MSPPLIRLLLTPMLAWAAHFFGGYALALALPASPLLDPLVIVLTVLVLLVLGFVWRRSTANVAHRTIVRQSTMIAALAISWQTAVILF